jgi:hypothetical protein
MTLPATLTQAPLSEENEVFWPMKQHTEPLLSDEEKKFCIHRFVKWAEAQHLNPLNPYKKMLFQQRFEADFFKAFPPCVSQKGWRRVTAKVWALITICQSC